MTTLDLERTRLRTIGGEEFYSPAVNQVMLLTRTAESYQSLADWLQRDGYFLVTLLANDERELADNCFKLYTVFSHPALDLFVILMFPLGRGVTEFPALHTIFAAATPFEREIVEYFGLTPSIDQPLDNYQHVSYPTNLHPLRRTTSTADIAAALNNHQPPPFSADADIGPLPPGALEVPVGPVHAGVIEPGHFRFHVAGEAIEQLDLHLGYTHKGVERLFQINYTLHDGWKLAEHVVGDSAFAHSLAYCRAVESLAGATPPRPAELARMLCLELERLYNHMGDCAALAHDVALELPASAMAAPREALLRLNECLAGHRFLRGINRPGGVILPAPLNPADIRHRVGQAVERFLPPAHFLLTDPGFRDRLMNTGVLTRDRAKSLGAIGLAARASDLDRDFRQLHPVGAESFPEISADLKTPLLEIDPYAVSERTAGDAYARYAIRVAEVAGSTKLIEQVLSLWDNAWTEREYRADINLRRAPNFRFGLGDAEGWRGPVVYWLMKDKFERIYRCKVTDPSCLNWPALKAAIEPHISEDDKARPFETLLGDFPIVNKSFNLSYAGNDL
ncbi:MAG TPA: NADH-quinone oxidoreductase subunit C [Anaerolineae bacterium]|nr:NADH-quinone oxidoreductase subunit C [Anaerolineae bacterium]